MKKYTDWFCHLTIGLSFVRLLLLRDSGNAQIIFFFRTLFSRRLTDNYLAPFNFFFLRLYFERNLAHYTWHLMFFYLQRFSVDASYHTQLYIYIKRSSKVHLDRLRTVADFCRNIFFLLPHISIFFFVLFFKSPLDR